MANASAWLLPLEQGLYAAVGTQEVVNLIQFPALFSVPSTPEHCHQVFVWQNQVLPALDLASWLLAKPIQRQDQAVVAVIAYQSTAGALPQYGGLLLSTLPTQLQVDDAQASVLPDAPARWSQIAVSCFQHEGLVVPIIDLPTIYSGALLNV